jgi:hypothetical protein
MMTGRWNTRQSVKNEKERESERTAFWPKMLQKMWSEELQGNARIM